MSNYKPNPLLDDYNKSSNDISKNDQNKHQAANIVNNFMSEQPDRATDDNDFAKIQAIYNNYQSPSSGKKSTDNSYPDLSQASSQSQNQDPKKAKNSWFSFGRSKKDKVELLSPKQTDEQPNPPVLRKKSWKNRLVWILAFGLIIGGLGWYLVAIQPAGLEVIHVSSQNQINKIKTDHNSTVTNLLTYTRSLDKYVNTNVSSSCSMQPVITDDTVQQSSMDEYLSKKLVLNGNYSQITDQSNILTYKYFDNNLNNIILSYEDSLKILKQNLESVSYIPSLIQYRNNYIQSCQALIKKGFNVETINQFCTSLEPKKTETIKYFTSLDIPSNSKLSTSVAKSIQECNNKPSLGTNGRLAKGSVTTATWQEQFDLDYDEFIGRRVQMDRLFNDIETQNALFDEEIAKVKSSNQKEYDRRKSGFPNYYLLQPNTRAIAKRLPI